MRTTRLWNNLHHVRSKSNDWKSKYFKVLGITKSERIRTKQPTSISSPMPAGEELEYQ